MFFHKSEENDNYLKVPFVDANALTHDLVMQYGPERSKELFMWIPAGKYEFAPDGKQDDTHLKVEGSHIIAKLLLDDMVRKEPRLKKYVLEK